MDLAKRLRSARKNSGLTQQQVCERCGIDDSSLSSFERGGSEPRLAQLDKLAEVYHLPLSYFFQESQPKAQVVMWRDKPDNEKEIRAQFLGLCRQYRQLEIWTGEISENSLLSLDMSYHTLRYAEAREMASKARSLMGLGERPGESLYCVLQEVYGVKIFHMDLGGTGAAACAVSPEFGQAILLNKRSARWRRNHDLAHEVFHLLTWEFFKHAEGICEPTKQEEKLATCFAGNLLLPTDAVRAAIDKVTDNQGRIPFSKLDKVAREFDVSLESLFWRMHFLYGMFDEAKTKNLTDRAREYLKTAPSRHDPEPPLFPDRYRALAIRALQDGAISVGRYAKFLKISRKEAERYIGGREPDYAQVPAPVA